MSEELSGAELGRYDRHIILPEVGLEGQKKLKASKVLLVGSGGLGSPLGLYLAAAGVGTLGIVDFDLVDESNLQRQIMHGSKTLGQPKTESARQRLKDLNPFVVVETFETRLSSENALDIMKEFDLIIDGTDNFATRYLVNDASVMLGKPNVYGSIFRFEGQVSIFHPAGSGPCYRCLYPEPPPAHLVPSCAEGGVFGVLPGVVGTLQATEAVKYIIGAGKSLLGRLLTFDALRMKFRELKVPRDPNCPLCGPNPTIKELVDYEQYCAAPVEEELPEVTPLGFEKDWGEGRRPILIDVREPHEWNICNLKRMGSRLVPLSNFELHLPKLPKDADIVVHCKSGGRSRKAQKKLIEMGYTNVRNLAGGILQWAEEIDGSLTRY